MERDVPVKILAIERHQNTIKKEATILVASLNILSLEAELLELMT